MGMADEVRRRVSAEQTYEQARKSSSDQNLREFSRHMDALAPEFADGAKQLGIGSNTRRLTLRGWYLESFVGGFPGSDSTPVWAVVIGSSGNWTWATSQFGEAKKWKGPTGMPRPYGADEVRQMLTNALQNLASRR